MAKAKVTVIKDILLVNRTRELAHLRMGIKEEAMVKAIRLGNKETMAKAVLLHLLEATNAKAPQIVKDYLHPMFPVLRAVFMAKNLKPNGGDYIKLYKV